MKHSKLKFEYSKITGYIYIGTNMCYQQIYFNKNLIKKKKVKVDISLEKKKVDHPGGVEYYIWLPTKDHRAPTLKQLKVGVAFLRELKKQKIKSYVHCEKGHGRAPTLVAAFLISEGMKVEEAIKFIKKKRKSIHLNKFQKQALFNFKKKL